MSAAPNFKRTKFACFFSYLAMSSPFCLPAMLFVTFRELYGISYTLLGTLVAVNFCTQLSIDLIFSFFTKYFNIRKTLRVMPILTSIGLLTYALVPSLCPDYAYLGLIIGTVVFSVAAGLSEVLLSPVVAALPSDNPERDMSLLHSLYAWGVLTVVLISSAFLYLFGAENWMYLTIFWAMLPLISAVLFWISPIPKMDLSPAAGSKRSGRGVGMALCVACIFLGSAAENTMTNWISAFLESALQIPKMAGDILGLAVFALLLGFGRTLYAKFGKNISNILLAGMIGAAVCYLVAGLSPNVIVSMLACILTGLCTSMLWPGTLILMEEKIAGPGVAAYALMAAGGDFGASVAPQMMGAVVDAVAASDWAAQLGIELSLTAEQIGMKVGMVLGAAFPLIGIALLIGIKRYFARRPQL
ncbi:MAG: MFS transporter [Clostridia bacterium]|nr:MFS transporter [Clostridia bacterium]